VSYKCQICRVVSPPGKPRLNHRIMRDRLIAGVMRPQCAAEVSVCQSCDDELKRGRTYTALLERHAPKPDEVAAPEYVEGERKVAGVSEEVSSALAAIDVKAAAITQQSRIPVEMVYSLFTRYGATSYWIAEYADAPVEKVCDAVAQHWHLRRLWDKLVDLVPKEKRKKLRRPEPAKPVLRQTPVTLDHDAVKVHDGLPKVKRGKQR